MSSDDTRTRILEAAGPIFADKGFQATTVREICQAADVNLASVNYHFGDKERLYIESVKQAHRLRMEQVPLPNWSPEAPPAEKLRDFIHTILTRMIGQHQAPWQIRLMMREILQPTSACRELVQENFRPHFELLIEIIRDILGEKVPIDRLHKIAFSIVGQCLFYRVSQEVVLLLIDEEERRDHFQLDELAEHIADLTLAALGARPLLENDATLLAAHRR